MSRVHSKAEEPLRYAREADQADYRHRSSPVVGRIRLRLSSVLVFASSFDGVTKLATLEPRHAPEP